MKKNLHFTKIIELRLILISLTFLPNILYGQIGSNLNLVKNYAIISGGTLTDNNPHYVQGLVAATTLNGQNASSDSTEINGSNLNNLIAEIEFAKFELVYLFTTK